MKTKDWSDYDYEHEVKRSWKDVAVAAFEVVIYYLFLAMARIADFATRWLTPLLPKKDKELGIFVSVFTMLILIMGIIIGTVWFCMYFSFHL